MLKKFLQSGKFLILISILIISFLVIFLSKKINKTNLVIDYVTVEKESDIKPLIDSLVVPILYSDVQLLSQLNTANRKTRFIDVMLPTILIYRHKLAAKKLKIDILIENARHGVDWSLDDSLFIDDAFKLYKTKNFAELIKRMEPPPISLVIAQSALESGWGSSRFFKQANNVFGIWSFSVDDERIIANQSREGQQIYLKKYNNLLGSVEDYHVLLAKSNTYDDFRDCIHRDNNVFELIWYLRMYSERRDQYIIMLRNVIVANNLVQYEDYALDPEFYDYPLDENAMF
ncbi:MAG: glucosaminidase domain-containing protein [Bacteroidales bacterium]|nr:glucosaminidase domain-containing protein [Bacteroidales bacterium]